MQVYCIKEKLSASDFPVIFPIAKPAVAVLISARSRHEVACEKPHSVMVTPRILIPLF